jgi:pimeloyl-ACP methyl ester carboxylesterase
MICFHGYGEGGDSFEFLGRYLGSAYSFYAIDLPFHGHTVWNEGLDFTKSDLEAIINTIVENRAAPWALAGFSLGGRIALSLYQDLPGRFNSLVLLAPDGLKVNFWYWLATQTKAGNRFFRFTMKHPGWFFGLLKVFASLRLVNKSIFKFVNYYIGDASVRTELYTRWTALRKLQPGVKKIKSLIGEHHTNVQLVYGKFDRIILPVVGENFIKGIESNCSLHILEGGHQVLHEKYVDELVDILQAANQNG